MMRTAKTVAMFAAMVMACWPASGQELTSAPPHELMPRRYIDYPVAYALWNLLGSAVTCSAALGDATILERARQKGTAMLQAAGYAPETHETTLRRFVAMVPIPPPRPAAVTSGSCSAAVAEGERLADAYIAGKAIAPSP